MRINNDASALDAGARAHPAAAGLTWARVSHPSGITSAITIIINQIYRATKAKNLLTSEAKMEEAGRAKEIKGKEKKSARGNGEKKRRGINRSLEAGYRLTGYDTGSAGCATMPHCGSPSHGCCCCCWVDE